MSFCELDRGEAGSAAAMGRRCALSLSICARSASSRSPCRRHPSELSRVEQTFGVYLAQERGLARDVRAGDGLPRPDGRRFMQGGEVEIDSAMSDAHTRTSGDANAAWRAVAGACSITIRQHRRGGLTWPRCSGAAT